MSQLSFALAKVKTLLANITITGAATSSGVINIAATGHGLETGDIVQISGVTGTVEANGQWVVTVPDANHFKLNNSTFANAYTAGGTAVHIGFATSAVLVDNTVFASYPNFAIQGRIESLSAGSNARMVFTDAADSAFVTEQPLEVVQVKGLVGLSYDKVSTRKWYDIPDARLAASGNNLRLKMYISGGPGSVCQFSAWLAY